MRKSGPVVVSRDNQIIQNVVVTADGTAGISGAGFANVVIRNCVVRHKNAAGISLFGCVGLRIEGVAVEYTGNVVGQGPDAAFINVVIDNCPGAYVSSVYCRDGASMFWVHQSSGVVLQGIEGHNPHGPFPRGQFVQIDKCDRPLLQGFYCKSDLDRCWTEDTISLFQSTNCLVRRGLIDGNNSPSGWAVIAEDSTGVCEDVDALHWSNGGFAASGEASVGFRFDRCREKDSYRPCSQGRGEPSSNSLGFGSQFNASGTIFHACVEYNLVNPSNVVWDAATCAEIDISTHDFVPRPAP